MKSESGRTLAEMLGVLSIITLLAISAIKGYNFLTTEVKVQNTAKMIKTLAFERQNFAMRDTTGAQMTVQGPHSSLHVENGTAGNHQPYFWVETTLSDTDFCEKLKESKMIQADFVEINDSIEGNCPGKISFFFKKNKQGAVYCPEHSLNCDTLGDATGCETGYYLDEGKCSACGEHVATCEDEETPLTCMEGYNLYGKECSETAPCSVDSDCDVCGTCGQDGYCTTMCPIPTPDENDECGNNDCIVYDNATGTCQYACERKEYLESTGTQYIDTGVNPKANATSVEFKFSLDQLYTSAAAVFGSRATNNPNDKAAYSIFTGTGEGTNRIRNDWSYGASIAPYKYGSYVLSSTLIDNQDILVKLNADSSSQIDDGIFSTSGVSKTNCNYPLLINAINTGGTVFSSKISAKWKYCKIWDNETLVRDFIPVVSPAESKCEGKPAMFDRVMEKLFCNEGTGEFLTD